MKITVYRKGVQLRLLDDLVKVFIDAPPRPSVEPVDLSVLRNDRLSFQLALSSTRVMTPSGRREHVQFARIGIESDIAPWITVRAVESVPVRYASHVGTPDNYLKKTPGLYPDVLVPLKNQVCAIADGEWRALWFDVETPVSAVPGDHPVVLRLNDPQTDEPIAEVGLVVTVLPAALPAQIFPRTEWFHADCLADYYHVPVFSEAHWTILRDFISAAVRRGINMILMPQFTPPLDTAVGWERTTTQLVEVFREDQGYRFDFANMRRWIEICLSCGVRYFEMSHLFSQWGAVAAPKVMGWEKGAYRQLFGWETPAVGGEYTRFLKAYLPELRRVLKEYGVEDRCYFHISDEPHITQLESYRAARESVREELKGYHFFEALSDYDFYNMGLVDAPVCATDRIEPFLAHETPHLWSYYCTAQSDHVSNCFIAQPSGLTRLYGAQMYKFGIEGSLRWGYNFYNTACSYEPINPFLVNDGGGCLPAGDCFIVYPGTDGKPWESIRMMVLDDGIRDLRAMRLLEDKIGREAVLKMLDEGLTDPLRFDVFPDHPLDAQYVLALRKTVNRALCIRIVR